MNYYLELWSVKSTNVTISLDVSYGETDLYLKKCLNDEYNDCELLQSDIDALSDKSG